MSAKLLLHVAPWSVDVQVLVAEVGAAGDIVGVARPMVIERVKEGDSRQPTMQMSRADAQDLMDQLWQIGLRPSEGTGSAGAMAATQAHLQDMRRLVFEQPVNRPG